MPTEKPIGHDGSVGPLPAPKFAGSSHARNSELPVNNSEIPAGLAGERSVLDELPCGYLILDTTGTIVFANRDFLRMTTNAAAEIIGSSLRKLLTSAGSIYFDTQILPTLHLSGRRNEIALDLKTNAGRLPVFATFSLEREPSDGSSSIRAVFVEASERRRFEQQILQSRIEAEQLAEVIHRSSDAIFTLLPNGEVRSWNNGAIALFDYSATEALGKPILSLLFIREYESRFELAMAGLERGEEFSGDSVGRRKDGSEVDISIKLTPHMEAPGTLVAFSAIVRDISLEKQAQRALLQSEKLASVGRLASSIAHEINNPLAAVTNLLYLLEMKAEDPDLKSLVRTAQDELARVSQITMHTLRFHRQSTKPVDLDLSKLFEVVLGLYRARLNNASIEARVERCDSETLFCHEGELRQIMLNIVGNAVDAMKSGGKLILRCSKSFDWRTGEACTRITIADTGTGMPRETVSKIFEPFFSTKGIGGTGLGLWVTKDLVEKNRGRILVRSSESATHHGTVFFLFFSQAISR